MKTLRDPDGATDALAGLLAVHRRILVFTGAVTLGRPAWQHPAALHVDAPLAATFVLAVARVLAAG